MTMNMKKCFSVLLSLLVSAIASAVVFAADISTDRNATRGDVAVSFAAMFGLDKPKTDYVRYFDVTPDNGEALFDAVSIMGEEKIMSGEPDGCFYPGRPVQVWEFVSAVGHLCANIDEDDVNGVLSNIFGEDYDIYIHKNDTISYGQLEQYMKALDKYLTLDTGSAEYRTAYYKAHYSPGRVNAKPISAEMLQVWSLDRTYVMLVPIESPLSNRNLKQMYFGTNKDYTLNGADVGTANMFVITHNDTYYNTLIDLFGNVITGEITISGIK